MDDLKSKAGGVLAVVVIVLWLMGMATVVAGILAGTCLVIGLMMTIERLPGFWKFATSKVGKPIVIIGTAILSHRIFGADGPMAMIALTWSLIFKVLVIEAHARRMELEA